MSSAIILAGGIGTRFGHGNIPKQYLKLNGMPLIHYTIKPFIISDFIESIIIVAKEEFHSLLRSYFETYDQTLKNIGFANAGASRQESLHSGLIKLAGNPPSDNLAIVHDAARPFIEGCHLKHLYEVMVNSNIDVVMPVIPMNDTIYYTEDGEAISGIPQRDKVVAGQSPEIVKFDKYLELLNSSNPIILNDVKGTTQFAYDKGLTVKLIDGWNSNFKITTIDDLRHACCLLELNFYDVLNENEIII